MFHSVSFRIASAIYIPIHNAPCHCFRHLLGHHLVIDIGAGMSIRHWRLYAYSSGHNWLFLVCTANNNPNRDIYDVPLEKLAWCSTVWVARIWKQRFGPTGPWTASRLFHPLYLLSLLDLNTMFDLHFGSCWTSWYLMLSLSMRMWHATCLDDTNWLFTYQDSQGDDL